MASVGDERLIAAAGSLDGLWSPDRSYYLEFTTGAFEGERFEVEATLSGGQVVAVDLASARNTRRDWDPGALLGSTFVIREHCELAGSVSQGTIHGRQRSWPGCSIVLLHSGPVSLDARG